MNAKEYLQSIRMLDIKLKTLESRISRYREDICTLKGTDLTASKVSGNGHGGIADKIAKLADMQLEAADK